MLGYDARTRLCHCPTPRPQTLPAQAPSNTQSQSRARERSSVTISSRAHGRAAHSSELALPQPFLSISSPFVVTGLSVPAPCRSRAAFFSVYRPGPPAGCDLCAPPRLYTAHTIQHTANSHRGSTFSISSIGLCISNVWPH